MLLALTVQPVRTGEGKYNRHTGEYEYSKKVPPISALGIFFFFIAVGFIAYLPSWALGTYSGKFWSTQAHLFGMEGVADLELLECRLFGICDGRLKWAANASTQSRHQLKTEDEHLENECEAKTPSTDELPRVQDQNLILGTDRLFTLVDTYSMTAMVFCAVHPPSVALVCGHEGGMRRTLLCSYNYKTQTFHRETVVRMPTKVLDRMDRVNKFRFSMTSLSPPKEQFQSDKGGV
ncbi:hypothetical protein BCR34DRAFT_598977 [Clohesyomyces aquaticus]|uniref:Uncharacterized protein n=1 Tax=Clohesyomyces aquaticus TaxID=1231657 RepID=A0A1Y1ZWI8_9PLEO|nr:hypothetical protein BCR34DRAFT_598977 [Clohesyomyces aquaticus]